MSKAELEKLVRSQANIIDQLNKRIEDLESELNKFNNSNTPPSGNKHLKPNTRGKGKKSKNKQGAQKRHKGITRSQIPDRKEIIDSKHCPDCGSENRKDKQVYKKIIEKIQDLTSEIKGKSSYISELENSNKLLSEQLNLALKYRYARSSEKWTGEDKNQMWLFNEAEMNASAKEKNEPEEKVIIGPYKRKKKKGRKPIADSIPRNYIEHKLTEKQRSCKKTDCPRFESCKKIRPVIGYDEREELDFI